MIESCIINIRRYDMNYWNSSNMFSGISMLKQSRFSPQKFEIFSNYIGVRIFNFSQIIKITKNSHYVVLHVSFFLSYAIISWLSNYLYYMKCWYLQCILMNVFMNRIPWNRKLKQLCQLDYVKFVVRSRNFKRPVLWEFSHIINDYLPVL